MSGSTAISRARPAGRETRSASSHLTPGVVARESGDGALTLFDTAVVTRSTGSSPDRGRARPERRVTRTARPLASPRGQRRREGGRPVQSQELGQGWRGMAEPPAPPSPQAARDLLADASRGLGRAIRADEAADRYAAAHLAALRAAAAVLAAKARPVRGRRGSVWELISRVAPEFSEWAAFFAAGSAKRQAAEAGLHRLVTAREADDMVRQVAAFLDLVERALAAEAGVGQRRTF